MNRYTLGIIWTNFDRKNIYFSANICVYDQKVLLIFDDAITRILLFWILFYKIGLIS